MPLFGSVLVRPEPAQREAHRLRAERRAEAVVIHADWRAAFWVAAAPCTLTARTGMLLGRLSSHPDAHLYRIREEPGHGGTARLPLSMI